MISEHDMIDTIMEAGLDMGQSGKLTDTQVLVDTSMLLIRVAQAAGHFRTDGKPSAQVLTSAYECAVSWLGSVAEVAAEEVAVEAIASKRGRKR